MLIFLSFSLVYSFTYVYNLCDYLCTKLADLRIGRDRVYHWAKLSESVALPFPHKSWQAFNAFPL